MTIIILVTTSPQPSPQPSPPTETCYYSDTSNAHIRQHWTVLRLTIAPEKTTWGELVRGLRCCRYDTPKDSPADTWKQARRGRVVTVRSKQQLNRGRCYFASTRSSVIWSGLRAWPTGYKSILYNYYRAVYHSLILIGWRRWLSRLYTRTDLPGDIRLVSNKR